MPPVLLLALVLLGMGCASRSAAASPVAVEQVLKELENDARCPMENETRTLIIPRLLGATTYRYTAISQCRTFLQAEWVCASCYQGRLASVHSAYINGQLQHLAQAIGSIAQVWIGAITQPQGSSVVCHWEDLSPWDYSHWVPGYPLHAYPSCATLGIKDGGWMTAQCQESLPFICEY